MPYEQVETGSDEKKVRCLRAKMKLCADPECYHSEPHEILDRLEVGTACTVYERCVKKNIVTRCVDNDK